MNPPSPPHQGQEVQTLVRPLICYVPVGSVAAPALHRRMSTVGNGLPPGRLPPDKNFQVASELLPERSSRWAMLNMLGHPTTKPCRARAACNLRSRIYNPASGICTYIDQLFSSSKNGTPRILDLPFLTPATLQTLQLKQATSLSTWKPGNLPSYWSLAAM